jgi:hypothetical protein
MKLKKMTLIQMIVSLQSERDRLFHEKEEMREEIKEVDTYEKEYFELREIKDLITQLIHAKERDYLGVALAREDFEKILDKLMDYSY